MALPKPEPGLVFRYDYLWARQSAARAQSGKERPACLVATPLEGDFVLILPITRSKPGPNTAAVEIPDAVRHALGLDHERSWVIVSEFNVDTWPNAGIAPVKGRDTFHYGFIPPRLFEAIRKLFIQEMKRGAKAVDRRE